MKHLGVIAGPGKPSLSPVFQQAAIDHLGLDITYEVWPTGHEGLAERVALLRGPDFLGANVTIPHKEAVMPMLDSVDALTERVGAVNTIVNRDGTLEGRNTDVSGFLRALRDDGQFDPRGCRAVVVGAGGAARAIVVALIDAHAARVVVANRTAERAERLARELNRGAGTALEGQGTGPEDLWGVMNDADLLVNCTSLGTAGTQDAGASPVPAELIRPEMLVFDLVYRPAMTPLLRDAAGRGARIVSGLPMLIYQGAASFEMWTGQPAPVDVMLAAARKALEGQRG